MILRIRLSILPILGFLALSSPASLSAQVGMITGKVTIGGSDRPLGQAQVIIEGTPISTVTNEAGEYRLLSVPAGPRSVLVRRLGFAPITQRIMVQVGETATLDFTVREAAVALDEIVVTATGDQRRKEIANSLESIDMSKLRTPVISSPQQLLAAQVPGVTVLANSGQPGAGGTIRLRGNNSISQGNNPIVYVDGVRIYSGNTPNGINARQNTSPFNDIKAEDIERVDVVKGAAATTLYGTEASGGVIQIFTKRGRSGAPRWDATIAGGTNDLDYLKLKGDPTAVWLKECRGPNMFAVGISASNPATFGQDIVFEDATCPASGKWIRKGLIQKYGLSVAGGGEVMQYFLAGNYNDEEGAIPTGQNKSGGFRGNFTFSPWRGLDLSLNTSYNKGTLQWVPDGNLANGFTLNVARGSGSNYKGAGCSNPAAICLVNGESIYKIHTFTRTDHFISGFTINYTPLQAWSNRLTIGFDYNHAENRSVTDFGQVRVPTGNVSAGSWNRKFLSIDFASTLKKALGTAFNSNVSLGGQIFQDQLFNTTVNGDVLGGPGDPTLLSAATRTVGTDTRRRVVNAGLFAQGQLSWKERAFFTAGVRVDGNSAFGSDFGLQPYPKVGLSYVVSEHAFWPDKIETFKIRGALGESGKAPGAFDAVKTWDPIAGDEAKPGFTPNQLGNPLLGPERTREMELGFEASAFDGRASVDFTWFNTRTNKALIQVQHPPSDGPWGRQLTNVGTVGNKGVEARFDLGFIRSRVFDWRGRFNYTHMKSEAIDIGNEIEIAIGDRTVVRKGLPVPAYYTKVLTNPDAIANPIPSSANQYVGPVFPPTIMSVGTTVTLWGKLTLDGLGEFQQGGYNINYIGYQNANRGVWRPCYETQRKLVAFAQGNTAALDGVTALERARCAIATTVQNSDYWLEPADFFRLRYVSLSYKLPPRILPGAKSATLTLSGRNLFLKTNYTGLDPESADQADNTFARREYYQLPSLRTFTIEMRVSW